MVQSVPIHNYPPLGLNVEDAAAYIGIGKTTFEVLVGDGRMPSPRMINRRLVWDREEIQMAFKELPKKDEKADTNPWDEEFAS